LRTLAAISGVVIYSGCQSYLPAPMTPEVVRAGARAHVDEQALRQGRALFVSRCIECHALPVISSRPAAEWPGLVDEMAPRADLRQRERNAVLAYILAVRAQTH
jgi:mono/diheme cytochrome c family protein